MAIGAYTDGQYLENNPTWHVEDSPWKAENVWRMIAKHNLPLSAVAEVGCGAGEILAQLQQRAPAESEFWGYDISPQSHEMASERANERLRFRLADLTEESDVRFDVLLVIDLIEHLDDYYGFLRKTRPLADFTILHIPLDMCAYSAIRSHVLLDQLRRVGHIHFFTKDTALAALKQAGYEVLDWFYPTPQPDREQRPLRQRLLQLTRNASYLLFPDLSIKAFGGRSLMVLAR
jgi:SAM-dependent methyltransferase